MMRCFRLAVWFLPYLLLVFLLSRWTLVTLVMTLAV